MSAFRPSTFLRRVLLADAAISGAAGVLMLAGASLVDVLLGLPAGLLREAGLILVPYGLMVGFLGTRERVTLAAVWAVIACNGLWAAGSVVVLISGLTAPTLLGYAFVIAQAFVVAAFAELQYMGLRRQAAVAA
jgi:hypothetical protein